MSQNKSTNADSTPPIDGTALTVLQNTRRGEILSDLSSAIRQVAGAVTLVGKPGKVTLILNITPSQVDGALVVSDDINVKIPKAPKSASQFYTDGEGNLFRNDPKQQELKLRTVDGGAASETPEPLRKVESN